MLSFKLPSKNEIKRTFSYFSKKEYFVFLVLVGILFISTVIMLGNINKSLMVNVPMNGGSLKEGIVGAPRFINPALAFSDADQGLVALIYSGLMRKNYDGTLIPDLAEKYDVSKDGLAYTFTLKNNLYFHDGNPITADDVVFTVNKIKDPITKSPIKGNWDGVSVEKVNEKTVKFTLKQSYSSFLENATIGIMPSYIWNASPIELNDANTKPIGSGPYQFSKISKQSSGVIDSYELTSFKKFALGEPYIKKLTLIFYTNESNMVSGLQNKDVDQISPITPKDAEVLKTENYQIESRTLPRVFGLFFNQNKNNIFTDKNVINAIDQAIDKDKIVREVLYGYGAVIEGPIPEVLLPKGGNTLSQSNDKSTSSQEEKLRKAQDILTKDGWKKGNDGFLEKTVTNKKKKVVEPLEFSISTSNAKELTETALLIKQELESIGIKVNIKTFEVSNLNQMVIRPRKYEALLFGQIINSTSDLFAFWHSTQRKDPGLNVAMYTNAKVDKILEDAFVTMDQNARIKKYIQFESEIKKDMPAIFLYSPDFIYVTSKSLQGFHTQNIISPKDRFLNSYLWYNQTDNVWKIFSK